MKRDVIEINKTLIPYEFEILLAGESFLIGVNYNETADLFTLDLSKINEDATAYDVICKGEPIIYGKPLWEDVYIDGKFPLVDIVPYDESGENDTVTFGNLGETVFLYIDGIDEDIEINVSKKSNFKVTFEYEDVYRCPHEKVIDELERMIDDSELIDGIEITDSEQDEASSEDGKCPHETELEAIEQMIDESGVTDDN